MAQELVIPRLKVPSPGPQGDPMRRLATYAFRVCGHFPQLDTCRRKPIPFHERSFAQRSPATQGRGPLFSFGNRMATLRGKQVVSRRSTVTEKRWKHAVFPDDWHHSNVASRPPEAGAQFVSAEGHQTSRSLSLSKDLSATLAHCVESR
jgi:ribosomal protein L34